MSAQRKLPKEKLSDFVQNLLLTTSSETEDITQQKKVVKQLSYQGLLSLRRVRLQINQKTVIITFFRFTELSIDDRKAY